MPRPGPPPIAGCAIRPSTTTATASCWGRPPACSAGIAASPRRRAGSCAPTWSAAPRAWVASSTGPMEVACCAERGLGAFIAVNASLAIATLRLLRDKGTGSKLTRPQVVGLAAHVAHALDVGLPLFDVQGLGPARVAPSESDHP